MINSIVNFFYKIWIWGLFLKYRNSLPTTSEIENPKMEHELFSGTFFWEDEGLQVANYQLGNAFKSVLAHRMKLIAGESYDLGQFKSDRFNKRIFIIAKRYFPNWIGFQESRCNYNPELAKRMMRIQKVSYWRFEKSLDEYDSQNNKSFL